MRSSRTPGRLPGTGLMSLLSFAAERAIAMANRAEPGRPFDPDTPMAPPAGHRAWAHYGVMMPGLPDPHRAFDVMSVVGTPGLDLFAADPNPVAAPRERAYLVSMTSGMHADQFHTYDVPTGCEFAPDGLRLRFGTEPGDVVIEGRWPDFTVTRRHADATVELALRATDKVANFVRVPGVYEHWSLLCEARGTIRAGDDTTDVAGLCTLEYATGVSVDSVAGLGVPSWLRVPARQFVYSVINIDERTQVLFSQVLGPGRLRLHQAVYERSVDDHGVVLTRGVVWAVHQFSEDTYPTTSGRLMHLPQRFAMHAEDDDRTEALLVNGYAANDWAAGLGAGFVGTFDYDGYHRGREIAGRGYLEFIDLRPQGADIKTQ